MEACNEALEIYHQLAEIGPADYGTDIARSLNNRGTVYRALKQRESAKESYRESWEILQALSQRSSLESLDEFVHTAFSLCVLLWQDKEDAQARTIVDEVWGVVWSIAEPRLLVPAFVFLARLTVFAARRETEVGDHCRARQLVQHLAQLRTSVADPDDIDCKVAQLCTWAMRAGHADRVVKWLTDVRKARPDALTTGTFFCAAVAAIIATTGDRTRLDRMTPNDRKITEEWLALTEETSNTPAE